MSSVSILIKATHTLDLHLVTNWQMGETLNLTPSITHCAHFLPTTVWLTVHLQYKQHTDTLQALHTTLELYCTVLYCTVLYCTLLYCIVL